VVVGELGLRHNLEAGQCSLDRANEINPLAELLSAAAGVVELEVGGCGGDGGVLLDLD